MRYVFPALLIALQAVLIGCCLLGFVGGGLGYRVGFIAFNAVFLCLNVRTLFVVRDNYRMEREFTRRLGAFR